MCNLGTKLFVYLSLFIHGVFSGGKILGGREALQGEFPFAVRISGGILCGGSLVTLAKLVSAAQCFEIRKPGGTVKLRDLSISYVVAGTINYKDQSGGYQQRSMKSYTLAKGAEMKHSGGMHNDIAVAELDKPFDTSDTVYVMTLKSTDPIKFKQSWDALVLSGSVCLSIGWGATVVTDKGGTFEPSKVSDVLKVIKLYPWSDDQCLEYDKDEDKDSTKDNDVCCTPAGDDVISETILPGDIGGPLICSGRVWVVLSSRDDPYQKPNHSVSHFYLFTKYIEELKLTGANTASALKAIPTPLIIYHMLLFFYH